MLGFAQDNAKEAAFQIEQIDSLLLPLWTLCMTVVSSLIINN